MPETGNPYTCIHTHLRWPRHNCFQSMKLIRGAPGSGKTALVFREFKDALRTGRADLRIVVPTATLVRHFQHELARDGVVFSPRSVVSLNRFVRERVEVPQVPDGLLHV